MKKITFFSLAAAAMTLAASCDNSAITPAAGEGSMQINFNVPSTTRAAAVGHEGDLNSVQMLIFDSEGSLYKYHSFSSAEITAQSATVEKVMTGSYSVYVVANGPMLDDITSLAALKATDIPLEQYNDVDEGFVMEGHKEDVTVSSGETASPSITISRYVSRVTLSSVTNGLAAAYGELTVKNVFLCNVVNTQNLGADKSAGNTVANWFNKEGRKDESTRNASHIIDGSTYTASAPELTFASVNSPITNGGSYSAGMRFYAYPNSATTKPDGFHTSFAAQRTVLTIAASFQGKTYYYPVVLTNSPARNTTYDVKVTITGAGSDDPVKPVDNGSIKAEITVQEWADGTSYTETF